jgi:hypothetical protein
MKLYPKLQNIANNCDKIGCFQFLHVVEEGVQIGKEYRHFTARLQEVRHLYHSKKTMICFFVLVYLMKKKQSRKMGG